MALRIQTMRLKSFAAKLTLVAMGFFFCSAAIAAKGDEFMMYDPSSIASCPAFLQTIGDEETARSREVNPPADAVFTQRYAQLWEWSRGFFSGYNLAAANGKVDVVGSIDAISGFLLMVEKHCKEKPTDAFADAILDSLKSLNELAGQ